MHRFFEDSSSIIGDKIYLNKNNSHHLSVLRITENEKFEVVIDGVVYNVSTIESDKNSVVCKIISKRNGENESNIKINLYQGLPKSDKLELIIQKCVELGVSSITPFISSRTIVKWDAKKEIKKLNRYNDISESASKQSKRTLIPKVNESLNFKEMLAILKDKFVILAYENRGESLKDILVNLNTDEINIIIGPEGGLSEEEVGLFEEIDAKIINLGNRILRTETAAISLTAMVQYEIGDINHK